jgi:flagellar protein FlgJ
MDSSIVSGFKEGVGETPHGEKGRVVAPAAAQDRKLRQACRDFESILLFNLFKEMRRTIPKSGLLPPAPGKETFQMMFDQKIAEDLSQRGEGMGLQQVLYEQLRRR